MSTTGEVIGQFAEFYSTGRHQEALDLITRERPAHPSYDALWLCYSAAMSSCLGDTAGALAAFRTALDDGHWYHEGALRGDPDFASLQNEPEFKAMVEENGKRRQAALAESKPQLIVLDPDEATQPAPLLIALHGNITNAEGFSTPWQSAVEKGWRVALPQSSKLSWLSGLFDWPDIDAGLNELDQHYQMLITQYAVDPSRVVIAGFSNGGRIAQQAAITKRIPVTGLLWIESSVIENLNQSLAAHQPFDFRAYFAAGQSQDFIRDAETLSQSLNKVGVACQIETMLNTYHEMPESFPHTLERALAFLCP